MTFKEFRLTAERTANYPGAMTGSSQALQYLALGLAGEASEVMDKHRAGARIGYPRPSHGLILELGDVAWYCARFLDELGLEFDEPECAQDWKDPHESVLDLLLAAGQICETVKKLMRDNGGRVADVHRAEVHHVITKAMREIATVGAYGTRVALSVILEANAEKLAIRQARGVLSGSGDYR